MKTCVLIGRKKILWVYAYSVEPKRAVVTRVGLWLRYTSVIGCPNKGPCWNDLQPLNWKRSLARARADVSPCHRVLSGAVFVRGANRLRWAPNKSRAVRRGEWRLGGGGGLRKTRRDKPKSCQAPGTWSGPSSGAEQPPMRPHWPGEVGSARFGRCVVICCSLPVMMHWDTVRRSK